MDLVCCVCLAGRGRPSDAETVIRGFAVCAPHIPAVARGPEWEAIVSIAERAQDPRR